MYLTGNSIGAKVSIFIDEYFTDERKRLFNKLMKDDMEIRTHQRLKSQDVEKLYKKALHVLAQLNSSHRDYEDVEELEYEFTHYLAAIFDKITIKESELSK